MDKKTILRVFGEAFLKTLIVILGVAIVIFAIYFMIQVFGGGKKDKKSTEDIPINTMDLNEDELYTDDSSDSSAESSIKTRLLKIRNRRGVVCLLGLTASRENP